MDADTVTRLLDEGAEPVARVARRLPPGREGRPRHPGTLVGWITRGKRGVRLEGFAGLDDGWWTSPAAVARFLAALTARALPGAAPAPVRPGADPAAAWRAEKRRQGLGG